VIYCAGSYLAKDDDFDQLIFFAVEKYRIPLAEIATRLPWGSETERVKHGNLEVLPPPGRPLDQVEQLVKDRKHIALLLQTKEDDIQGEFKGPIESDMNGEWVSYTDDLSDNQTTITGDISVLNDTLINILDRYDALEAEAKKQVPK
jgi:hypothetical protein